MQFLITPVEYGGEIIRETQVVNIVLPPTALISNHLLVSYIIKSKLKKETRQWPLRIRRKRTLVSIFLTVLTFWRIFSFIFGFSRWRSFALELGYPVTRLWN